MIRPAKILLAVIILILAGIGWWGMYSSTRVTSVSLSESNEQSQKDLEPNAVKEDTDVNSPLSFIESLRTRQYQGGQITTIETVSQSGNYTTYRISYPSDDLTIYGIMKIPNGDGPFPVVILNHGYFNSFSFQSGNGTEAMANILATNGYLTLAPDYRGHGQSEDDGQASHGHRPEYAVDVLNLIASVNSLSKADSRRIGMWGHSMGGEVSLRVAEATDVVKATALWAPTSARVTDNTSFYGGRKQAPSSESASEDGASPINYLTFIQSPISLHQGLADTEVNPEWSKELNNALEQAGKSVEYFEYPGQDHNFRNLGWDEISRRTMSFFDTYLKSS